MIRDRNQPRLRTSACPWRRFFAAMTMILFTGSSLAASSRFLFVWAADADAAHTDFVAVLDADPDSRSYGDVLTTLPVGMAAAAHHTEHRMSADGHLFVNGFRSGTSFVVDLRDPLHPRLNARFTGRGLLSYPHSFERLPDGRRLATFQNGAGGVGTGGLVELDLSGRAVRSASAGVASAAAIRPYSLAILPELDRVVSTTASMRDNPMVEDPGHLSKWIQVWRLSDLELLHTLEVPAGPRGDEHYAPAEPRVHSDGRTVLFNTFRCGFYRLTGLESEAPQVEHLSTLPFEHASGGRRHCALPALASDVWVQTVPARNGLVALDVSDPAEVRELSTISLGRDRWTHWISAEPDGHRLVVTGYQAMEHHVGVVRLESETGGLVLDDAFGDGGWIEFDRTDWPHGETGAAIPHGAVFSMPPARADAAPR